MSSPKIEKKQFSLQKYFASLSDKIVPFKTMKKKKTLDIVKEIKRI